MIHRSDRSPRRSTYRHATSALGFVLAIACVAASPALAQTEQAAPTAPKLKVAFIGDSTSDGIWGGLSQLSTRNACLKTAIDLGRFAKNSTGLTRPDRFNWAEETKRVGETYKPSLYMMSLGLNDRQSVVVNGQITPENSPGYPDKYKERVTAVLASAAATKASLLWVGLPAMRVPASNKDARLKNQFFVEAIADFGVHNIHYGDPWKLNPSAEEDKFSSYGPDVNGKIVQIRASDGEHFTTAGDLLVAVYLLPKMLTILAERGEQACSKTEGHTQ
jgi:uncharacterized protein